MQTINTFAVAVTNDRGTQVVAKCHNRVTAELIASRIIGNSALTTGVHVLAPGGAFDSDLTGDKVFDEIIALLWSGRKVTLR